MGVDFLFLILLEFQLRSTDLLIFDLLLVEPVLRPDGLLDVGVAQGRQQLIVPLLLPHKRLILGLSNLLLRLGECLVVLCFMVDFGGLQNR